MIKTLRKIFSELGWTFNRTKLGNKCWAIDERLRERELRSAYRRAKRK